MATIVGTLIFEMAANVARLQTDMQKANATVSGAMDGIKGAATMARNALGAIGVVLSVDAFAGMVRGSIEAINGMRELGIKTGNTTEALYGLRPAAKAAHTEMDQVATGLQFLAKNMNTFATTGKGQAVQAFEELGISVTDTSGKLRSSSEVMLEVAQKLTEMEDRTKAVALAKQLLGKAGAQLLPMLEELARLGLVNATGMNEQGEKAHEFMLQLTLLESRSAALKREMAIGLLPSLIKITSAFSELTDKREDTRGFWETVGTMMEWVAKIANGAWTVLRLVGEAIGGQLAVWERLRNFDLRGALTVYHELGIEMNKILLDAAKVNEKISQLPPLPKPKGKGGPAEPGDAGAGGDFGASNLVANFAGGSASTSLREFNRQLVDTRDVGREVGNVFDKSAQQGVAGFSRTAGAVQRLKEELFRIIQGQVQKSLPNGGKLPGAGDIIRDIFGFGGSSVPSYDVGTPYVPQDQLAMVHKGEAIIPAGQNGGASSGAYTGGDTYFIDARGADQGAITRLWAAIRSVNGSIESRAASSWKREMNIRGFATPSG